MTRERSAREARVATIGARDDSFVNTRFSSLTRVAPRVAQLYATDRRRNVAFYEDARGVL